MTSRHLLAAVSILAATLPAAARGQRADALRIGPPPSRITAAEERPELLPSRGSLTPGTMAVRSMFDSTGTHRSYWLPGLIVGAALGLDFGISLHNSLCESDCHHPFAETAAEIAGSTLVFAVLGALLGSAIHRH